MEVSERESSLRRVHPSGERTARGGQKRAGHRAPLPELPPVVPDMLAGPREDAEALLREWLDRLTWDPAATPDAIARIRRAWESVDSRAKNALQTSNLNEAKELPERPFVSHPAPPRPRAAGLADSARIHDNLRIMTQSPTLLAPSTPVVVSPTPRDAVHPPQVPLAFRVGIVGHRPSRLQAADPEKLSRVLRELLKTVRDTVEGVHRAGGDFARIPPALRAVSPLAEGTDRLFAEAALAEEFQLCGVLPFSREEFERDFTPDKQQEPDSLARFRSLLNRSAACLELDGQRSDEGAAYGAAGRLVLRQSDLLVVVWDGRRLGKPGGTEQTLDEARQLGVPVMWIDAKSPHDWQVLQGSDLLRALTVVGAPAVPRPGDTLETLASVVRCTLAAPDDPKPCAPPSGASTAAHPHEQMAAGVSLRAFCADRRPRFNLAQLWRLFLWFFTWESKFLINARKEFFVEDFESAVKAEWPEDTRTYPSRLINYLRPYYAWPDRLSALYADAYRSAIVGAYVLSAIAVGLALLPVAMGWFTDHHHIGATISIIAEVATIFFVLALVFRGRRCRWHDRWIDYRLTAEMVRHLRLVGPLGGPRPFPQVSGHLQGYRPPAGTWMTWYVRAVERSAEFPTGRVDAPYLADVLAELVRTIEGQITFHREASHRCHTVERRIHLFGASLLGLTIIAGLVHLSPLVWKAMGEYPRVGLVMTFLCGFLPALGAALAGISNQAEFRRVARRSRGMLSELDRLLADAKAWQESLAGNGAAATPTSVQVASLAATTAQLMVNEVIDWRVVFLDRPSEVVV